MRKKSLPASDEMEEPKEEKPPGHTRKAMAELVIEAYEILPKTSFGVRTQKVIDKAKEKGCNEDKAAEIIEKIKLEGKFYSPKSDYLKRA